MQLSKPELTAFRIKNKNHFLEVFWTLKVTSPTAPWAAGGGCGPSETAAGLLRTRRGRRDLAGQLSASGHGPSSHRPSAPCTQRARPTPPTASATPTLTTRPPGPGSGSIRPKTTNKEEARVRLRGPPPAGAYTPRGVVVPDKGQLLPGAGRRECTASRVPLVHCSLSCAHRNKGAGDPGGSRRVLGAPGAPALRASRRPDPAFTCTSLSSTRKYSSRCR